MGDFYKPCFCHDLAILRECTNLSDLASFKGEYHHSVDAKGRVAFPAKLRKALNPDAGERFTLLRGLEPCLYLYPGDEWEQVEEKLSRINSFSKKGRTVKRNFLRFAEDVTLDGQHRIPLSAQLMEYASIDSAAIFIGSGERIEIWAPDQLEKLDEDMSPESYEELFEEVLGNDSQPGS